MGSRIWVLGLRGFQKVPDVGSRTLGSRLGAWGGSGVAQDPALDQNENASLCASSCCVWCLRFKSLGFRIGFGGCFFWFRGLRVSGRGFRDGDSGVGAVGLGCRVWVLGFGVWGSELSNGFRISGSAVRFRISGSRCRVQD